MTASRTPKTPSMGMLVRAGIAVSDIDSFCRKASRLTLAQVVDKVIVKEKFVAQGTSRSKNFTIELAFYPKVDYQSEYDVESSEILAVFGTKFPLILKREVQNELKKLDQDMKSQMTNLGKGKAVRSRLEGRTRGGAEAEEEGEGDSRRRRADEDDISEVGDGDATAEKRLRQAKEQATYEDDADEDDDADTDGFLKEFDDAEIEAAYASADDVASDDVEMTHESDNLTESASQVEQLFMENFVYTTSFSFSDAGCSIGLQVRRELTELRSRLDGVCSLVPICLSCCSSAS